MSRYEYLPEHWPEYVVAVGWDPAMYTYFAQVMNYRKGRDDDCVVLWIGALHPHYDDIDQMMQALNKGILGRLHPVVLSETTRRKFTRDREQSLRESRPRKRRNRSVPSSFRNRNPARQGPPPHHSTRLTHRCFWLRVTAHVRPVAT